MESPPGAAGARDAVPGTPQGATGAQQARNKPCKECRLAKARCLWPEDTADPRCTRCREKARPCTKWTASSGVVAPEDGDGDGAGKQRRARWACVECKRRKRACEGGKPIFRSRPAKKRPAEDASPDADAPEMDGMTPCEFCLRHGLECVYPAATVGLRTAVEMESKVDKIKEERKEGRAKRPRMAQPVESPGPSEPMNSPGTLPWGSQMNGGGPSAVSSSWSFSQPTAYQQPPYPSSSYPTMTNLSFSPQPSFSVVSTITNYPGISAPSAPGLVATQNIGFPPSLPTQWGFQGAAQGNAAFAGHQRLYFGQQPGFMIQARQPQPVTSPLAYSSFATNAVSQPSLSFPPQQTSFSPLMNASPLAHPFQAAQAPSPMSPFSGLVYNPSPSGSWSPLTDGLGPLAAIVSEFPSLPADDLPLPLRRSPSASVSFLLNDDPGRGAFREVVVKAEEVAGEVFEEEQAETVVPLPLSQHDATLPSSEGIFWMINRFWECYAEFGRTAVIQKHRFSDTCLSGAPSGGPLLWTALWGACVWDRGALHPELTPRARRAVSDRARMVLVGGLYRAMTDLQAALPEGDADGSNWAWGGGLTVVGRSSAGGKGPGFALAKRTVPIIQALVLGLNFSEKAGGEKNMVALVNLAVRMARLAGVALRGWIRGVVTMLTEPAGRKAGPPAHIADIDAWMAAEGIVPPFPPAKSLSATLISPERLAKLGPAEREEVVLLTEFAGCYFYCLGCDLWSADLIGSKLQYPPMEVDEVPVPFDGRDFEFVDFGRIAYSGEISVAEPTPAAAPLRILPVVPTLLAVEWMAQDISPERRGELLAATVGDIFRVGAHFALHHCIAVERKWIELRRRALEAGLPNVYPIGFRTAPWIRAEVLRLRAMIKEVVDALPPEMRKMEAEGRIGDLFALLGRCPTICDSVLMSMIGIFIWNYEFQASARGPPPSMDPEPAWYSSTDGIEAGSFAIMGSRLLAKMLESGFDVNDHRMLRWFHTRIDRLTRIIFLHLRHAQRHSLSAQPLFENAMVMCLRWFAGLEGQARYNEWLSRLGFPEKDFSAPSSEAGTSDMDPDRLLRMVVSAQDKKLAEVGRSLSNVDVAVMSLVAPDAGADVPTVDED